MQILLNMSGLFKTKMQITFLGTACMQPTKERSHPAILISYGSENILMDCGEGTQRQLKIAGIKPAKITRLLISHWHGDHVLGIPGLMQTMEKSEYSKKLHVYGPVGSKEKFDYLLKIFPSKDFIDFELHELGEGVFFESNDFLLEAMKMKHGIETLGYSFIEKDKRKIKTSYVKKLGIPDGPLLGKLQSGIPIDWKGRTVSPESATSLVKGIKVTYLADTMQCSNCAKLAENADILISEASFTSEHEDKAEEYMHITAKQAALIANQANAKKLVLTHFSQRYKDTYEILDEAKTYFDNVVLAHDFMKIKL